MSKSANTLKTRPQISSLALIDRKRIDFLIAKYGEYFYPDLCSRFPTYNRERLYPNLEVAIRDKAPSLQEMDRVWSDDVQLSLVWLKYQLTEVFAYVGLRDKISEIQKTSLAKVLRNMCVDQHMAVTLSELMVFFSRFEQGKYERFFGYEHANPQVVTSSLETFLNELYERRVEVYRQMKSEQELAERDEWAKSAVPPPESSKKKMEELFNHFNAKKDERKAEYLAKDFELSDEEKKKTLQQIAEAQEKYRKK